MRPRYSSPEFASPEFESWVEAHVTSTMQIWTGSATHSASSVPRYTAIQQQQREAAYDEALFTVEQELKRVRTRSDRNGMRARLVAAFARFSASALDLPDAAVKILTEEFLPVGVSLAQWARQFDATLSMPDITQACRNAWTACGMQPLLGERIRITPSILGYSLLYPYSDNYLDREEISAASKLHFSHRFRERLRGHSLTTHDAREHAIWTMVCLIEDQYPRASYPQVFDCLLAIHHAQEESIAQVTHGSDYDDTELLRMSCAKGGTSVLADACLTRGWLNEAESIFAFEWGVLLQLGDDLQDVQEDMQRGSVTLFSRAAAQGIPLDHLVIQLLNFANHVGARMDQMGQLPNSTPTLKNLLKMSWRSLIVGAVAQSHQFFSPGFLAEAEQTSPFRFAFLRARRERLTSRQGLYATLFEAFLDAGDKDATDSALPNPSAIPQHIRPRKQSFRREAEISEHCAEKLAAQKL